MISYNLAILLHWTKTLRFDFVTGPTEKRKVMADAPNRINFLGIVRGVTNSSKAFARIKLLRRNKGSDKTKADL